jgi:ABC-2 type transport system ATP-binding protein
VQALKGVDLVVGEGELFGLLGPNGAGKSTLVKIAVGLVRQTKGEAEVAGARAGSRTARASLGYLAELFRFPGWCSADELLRLHQRLSGSAGGAAERAELLGMVGLGDVAAKLVEAMSKGMQQRLGIAQALVGAPELLLLDEPTSALDLGRRMDALELIDEVRREQSLTVLSAIHDLTLAGQFADRLLLLSGGQVAATGEPAKVLTDAVLADHFGSGIQVLMTDSGEIAVISSRSGR